MKQGKQRSFIYKVSQDDETWEWLNVETLVKRDLKNGQFHGLKT